MENPIKMDDLGIPLFLETPNCRMGIFQKIGHSEISSIFVLVYHPKPYGKALFLGKLDLAKTGSITSPPFTHQIFTKEQWHVPRRATKSKSL